MFDWFWRFVPIENVLKGDPVVPKVVVDPWEGSGLTYVLVCKDKIDTVAELLSELAFVVKTRFNKQTHCAELYTEKELLATIMIYGECGLPEFVYVRYHRDIFYVRGLFIKAFPGLHVDFEPLV